MSQPGWYPDPLDRFDHRYFDGAQWTDQVSRGGALASDPPTPSSTPAAVPPATAASASGGTNRPRPGWYSDPTGHHGQRWWEGGSWTDQVADGQAMYSDPLAVSAPPASPVGAAPPSLQRTALERAVEVADEGQVPEHWPERYEAVIAAVLGALEAGETVRAAWRMRTIGTRHHVSDVGLIVLTDRRVVGADQSSKSSGLFAVAAQEIATVALVNRRMGISDLGWEIHLLDTDGDLLGTEDSPAEFQVFGKGRDPSRWDIHPQGENDLAEVQGAIVALLPGSTAARSVVDLAPTPHPPAAADLSAHPPPQVATFPPPPTYPPTYPPIAPGVPAAHPPGKGASASVVSKVRAIAYVVGGLCLLAIVAFLVLDVTTSDCERNGVNLVCRGGGLETSYNLFLVGLGGLFGPAMLWGGISALRQARNARPAEPREGPPPAR